MIITSEVTGRAHIDKVVEDLSISILDFRLRSLNVDALTNAMLAETITAENARHSELRAMIHGVLAGTLASEAKDELSAVVLALRETQILLAGSQIEATNKLLNEAIKRYFEDVNKLLLLAGSEPSLVADAVSVISTLLTTEPESIELLAEQNVDFNGVAISAGSIPNDSPSSDTSIAISHENQDPQDVIKQSELTVEQQQLRDQLMKKFLPNAVLQRRLLNLLLNSTSALTISEITLQLDLDLNNRNVVKTVRDSLTKIGGKMPGLIINPSSERPAKYAMADEFKQVLRWDAAELASIATVALPFCESINKIVYSELSVRATTSKFVLGFLLEAGDTGLSHAELTRKLVAFKDISNLSGGADVSESIVFLSEKYPEIGTSTYILSANDRGQLRKYSLRVRDVSGGVDKAGLTLDSEPNADNAEATSKADETTSKAAELVSDRDRAETTKEVDSMLADILAKTTSAPVRRDLLNAILEVGGKGTVDEIAPKIKDRGTKDSVVLHVVSTSLSKLVRMFPNYLFLKRGIRTTYGFREPFLSQLQQTSFRFDQPSFAETAAGKRFKADTTKFADSALDSSAFVSKFILCLLLEAGKAMTYDEICSEFSTVNPTDSFKKNYQAVIDSITHLSRKSTEFKQFTVIRDKRQKLTKISVKRLPDSNEAHVEQVTLSGSVTSEDVAVLYAFLLQNTEAFMAICPTFIEELARMKVNMAEIVGQTPKKAHLKSARTTALKKIEDKLREDSQEPDASADQNTQAFISLVHNLIQALENNVANKNNNLLDYAENFVGPSVIVSNLDIVLGTTPRLI